MRPTNDMRKRNDVKQMIQSRSPRRGRWLGAVVGAVAIGLATVPSAHAAFGDGFGFVPGSLGVSVSNSTDPANPHDANPAAPVTQAGATPAYFTTRFEFNTFVDGGGNATPDGNARDIDVKLPPGMVVNARATPTCDRGVFFETNTSGVPCPASTQIGVVTPTLMMGGPGFPVPTALYNLQPGPGKPAEFGFIIGSTPVVVSGTVSSADPSDGGYRIGARLHYVSNAIPVLASSLTLWGVPADPRHDGSRGACLQMGGSCPVDVPRNALLTTPARCDAAELATDVAARSWQNPKFVSIRDASMPVGAGCDRLPFAPSATVRADNARAGAPAGLAVQIDVPYSGDPVSLATPPLRNVEVELPDGMAISPSAADGLGACTDGQLGLGSDDPASCPASAKLGELSIDTPLLGEPLTGPVYLGSQESNDPMSGDMYRLFMVAEGQGVRIKLRGAITADPVTGKLRTRFVDTPQMPFERMRVNLKGGARAPLVNPTNCGPTQSRVTLRSWAGQEVVSATDGAVDQACPSGGFAPTLVAGTLNPLAGAFSPFTMTVSRQDSDPELSKLSLDLPSGLLGAAGDVPLCAEAQAAAGTCADAHRIGSTTVSAGPGASPFTLSGNVYLAGPYKGAPMSLSVVVPAKAGPIDLGLVVVRAPLLVDAANARVSAPADPLPTILGGVPLKMRDITVTLDRPEFMFNATSCNAGTIGATLTSVGGVVAKNAARYQAQGCAGLPLSPRLSLEFAGQASDLRVTKSRRGHPGVNARMTWPRGHANLKQVRVDLPLAVALDPKNAKALCTPEEAAARNCPEASIVGRASATTPALHEPLSGPVYFVEGRRTTAAGKTVATLPRLWLKLEGQGVPLDLWANSDVANKQLTSTFVDIPDAPIREFSLEIFGGEHGILAATANVCTADRTANARYDGQNGKVVSERMRIGAPPCRPQIASVRPGQRNVVVRVAGIGAGKLAARGTGMRGASRTIKSADAASLTLRLSAESKRRLARGATLKRTIRVQFAPKTGKTVTLRKSVKIKPARR